MSPERSRDGLSAFLALAVLLMPGARTMARTVAPLPDGVTVVWDLDRAHREATGTRERICVNGLWRWRPADGSPDEIPADGWGHFKVPGAWPGITDYMQKDTQTVHRHPDWMNLRLGGVTAAWYEREITIPPEWKSRRIVLRLEYLNSHATVYVDGERAAEIRFPGGDADLTSVCRPGGTHRLDLLVAAMPLQGVLLSYSDTASAREVQGTVRRRGLCGDVFLLGTPAGARIADVRVSTSTRRGEITLDTAMEDLGPSARYVLRAEIRDGESQVATISSPEFGSDDLAGGRLVYTASWRPEKLWDVHTPQNIHLLELSLVDTHGVVLDAALPVRFGFRELWIDGRDIFLNGSRIFLSAVPLDNAQVGTALASYAGARESLERLRSFGINFVYTHNYGCEPGSHLSFAEILRAADEVGVLVALSQPHFAHYGWDEADADRTNGYARHAAYYVGVAGNHPSVVFYSMSHNATGYSEDMNPDMIDGIRDDRDTWSLRNARRARRAEAIVRSLDASRVVYHHASGNLGAMHTSNFYPNFAPVQELSDWFEHWATEGVKPVFTCEYGAPFTWDWTMYRGWYRGERSFGSARVPWEFCFAEWNAQFLGDRAFRLSEMERENLRWESAQFRAGRLWHRWDYPHEIASRVFDDRYEVFEEYLTANWRAFRTWGVSAVSPWEHGHFWRLRNGVERGRRRPLATDWENLQRPGFSPDFIGERYERMDLAHERSDWIATPAARALLRNNMPLLAYIAGEPGRFTSRDHNFVPGETVEKQIVVVNNSREAVSCRVDWSLGLRRPLSGKREISLGTGAQARIPVRLGLPPTLAPGAYELSMTADFGGDVVQRDSFTVHVLPSIRPGAIARKIALFDPPGDTGRLLAEIGIRTDSVEADTDLRPYEVLVIGRRALAAGEPGPDIRRVREGLEVIVFEQSREVLESRFGFRAVEYGLRQVFPRLPAHPILAGLGAEHLRDWRGEATLLPPRLDYRLRPRHGPTVQWCGIDVTRVWRCGCRGNVASVLIEKPARGDFLPLVDGGFSLQYSPLLEYREGRGMVLFCQLDVTGRTELDPAARTLLRNVLTHVSAWSPSPQRRAVYSGEPAGRAHLQRAGFAPGDWTGEALSPGEVLVVGPGGSAELAGRAAAIERWLDAGGQLLAIGIGGAEASTFLPFTVRTEPGEHIDAWFEAPAPDSLLAGVGPADFHNRDPRIMPLVKGGPAPIGDGVLARSEGANVVLCQLVPWRFDYRKQYNVKRTYRRVAFLVTRLLANMGAGSSTPVLDRFHRPASSGETRWLDGLYLDAPEEMDDPYRFFRW